MFKNSSVNRSSLPDKSQGKNKTGRILIYYQQETGISTRIKPSDSEGWEVFDSVLEFQVYLFLCGLDTPVLRQHPVTLIPALNALKPVVWKVDFYLPAKQAIIEVKGSWINNADAKKEKALFNVQWHLAIRQRAYDAYLVSDCEFQLADFSTTHYRELSQCLQ